MRAGPARPSPGRRVLRHAALAVASGAGILALALPGAGPPAFRLSVASAHVALVLFGAGLVLGPLGLLRGRPLPVSSGLRRELGIWAALVGALHAGVGLTVHLAGDPPRPLGERAWLYFFRSDGGWMPRTDSFGLANHAGLGALVLLLGLLALSSDRSLGALGAARWKALHRGATYPAFVLAAGHAGLYQALGRRALGLVLLFALTAAGVAGLQLAGYLWRRRAAGPTAGA